MRIGPASMSLRTRLLLACTLVQVMMLVLLIVNGIRVVDDKLNERTQVHLEEQKQLLNAALQPARGAPVPDADRDTGAGAR
jgi:hypothetical protein